MHPHMSYSLNSFKGVISRIIQRSIIGLIKAKGDTRSSDYSSHGSFCRRVEQSDMGGTVSRFRVWGQV